ncbi:ATP-binding cassette domain-containing protein [Telmatobacter sp. DSM 110680]|uniref:ATP-binding cassette domain-containing protein n=1 Tax=Telmatobacter sp. DSM 110680 TaxID=3036704 RepID=A0AAU7DF16_9BACT
MADPDLAPTPNSDPSPDLQVNEVPEIPTEVLADIAGDKPASTEEEQTTWPLISFKHVSMWFGERKVLDNVSFYVNRGETLCILGRSGVGKSVSLRILLGFLKPQVGSIRVDGQEINQYTEEEMQAIRRRITMVFQNGALFDSLTVRENVAFPLRERGGQEEDQVQQVVDRLLGLVGADDVPDALPASLSAGRRRAVAIARALASQPEVVLYDEPTTMVDPIIARRLGGLIQRLKQQLGFTSIVVTHDMRFAERLADTVLFLDEGRAAFFGPLKDFMASPEPHIQQFLTLDAYVLPSA